MIERTVRNPKAGILMKYILMKGWSNKRIEVELGISQPTRCSRMQNPDSFKIGEISSLLKGMEITRKEAQVLYGVKITD